VLQDGDVADLKVVSARVVNPTRLEADHDVGGSTDLTGGSQVRKGRCRARAGFELSDELVGVDASEIRDGAFPGSHHLRAIGRVGARRGTGPRRRPWQPPDRPAQAGGEQLDLVGREPADVGRLSIAPPSQPSRSSWGTPTEHDLAVYPSTCRPSAVSCQTQVTRTEDRRVEAVGGGPDLLDVGQELQGDPPISENPRLLRHHPLHC
jgi:hypothetical protein